jgi:hypothetical protein
VRAQNAENQSLQAKVHQLKDALYKATGDGGAVSYKNNKLCLYTTNGQGHSSTSIDRSRHYDDDDEEGENEQDDDEEVEEKEDVLVLHVAANISTNFLIFLIREFSKR